MSTDMITHYMYVYIYKHVLIKLVTQDSIGNMIMSIALGELRKYAESDKCKTALGEYVCICVCVCVCSLRACIHFSSRIR
jgi:hypothetical protein